MSRTAVMPTGELIASKFAAVSVTRHVTEAAMRKRIIRALEGSDRVLRSTRRRPGPDRWMILPADWSAERFAGLVDQFRETDWMTMHEVVASLDMGLLNANEVLV